MTLDSGKIPTHPKGLSFREALVKIMLNKDWVRFRNHYGIIQRGWISAVGVDSVTIKNPHEETIVQMSQLVAVQRPESIAGVEKQMELDWKKFRRKK